MLRPVDYVRISIFIRCLHLRNLHLYSSLFYLIIIIIIIWKAVHVHFPVHHSRKIHKTLITTCLHVCFLKKLENPHFLWNFGPKPDYTTLRFLVFLSCS